MRNRSPANSAASPPPVPARISRNRLASSRASAGISSSPRRLSSASISADSRGISSSASARISGSSRQLSASCRSRRAWRSAARPAATGSSRAYSWDSSRKRALSEITAGSDSIRPTSACRSARLSSLRSRLGLSIGVQPEQLFGGLQQLGIAVQRGPAQCGGRAVQDPVAELVGQRLQHGFRVLAAGQRLLGFRQQRLARLVDVAAQLQQAALVVERLELREEMLGLQADQVFGLDRGLLAERPAFF